MDANGNDIQTVDITSVDEETVQMEHIAKEVAQILSNTYPRHLWAVGWAPGMTLIVKNMAIPGNYGYTIDAARVSTSSELVRLAKVAGGELLERCGMPRGTWDGEFATKLEGSDPRHFKTI